MSISFIAYLNFSVRSIHTDLSSKIDTMVSIKMDDRFRGKDAEREFGKVNAVIDDINNRLKRIEERINR